MPGHGEEFKRIESSLRKAAAALREAGISFALGGSLAAWARGGPESCKDLDLMIRKQDVERALAALTDVGMRTERPPEDWLVKAWDGEVLIDLIHHALGVPISDEVLERADEMAVFSISMRVLTLEDLLSSKLLALNEHSLDYESVLTIARSVREQVNWQEVRARTTGSPYASAFFTLMEELNLLEVGAHPHEVPTKTGAKIRVVPPS
jgi:predicted nucleotidyltransferase